MLGNTNVTVGSRLERLKAIHVELNENSREHLDTASYRSLLGEEGDIAYLLVAEVYVKPHGLVSPIGLLGLAEVEAFHMGISGHILDNTLCLTEELLHVIRLAYEGTAEMLLLARQLFNFCILAGIISVKEDLSLLKDCKLIKVSLVLNNSLTDVGKESGTEIFLRG